MTNPKDRAVQDQALPIAQHEMGHYIVGKALGFRVGDVSITITFPRNHYATASIEPATSLATREEICAYIENRCISLYAGALAETLKDGKIDNEKALRLLGARPAKEMNEASATQDHAKVRELIHLLRSATYDFSDNRDVIQRQLDDLDGRIWNRAIEIVEAEGDLIVGLARNLASRVKKSGVKAEITELEFLNLSAFTDRFKA